MKPRKPSWPDSPPLTGRMRWVAGAVLVVAMLGGCASTGPRPALAAGAGAGASPAAQPDPWENFNRKVFAFNDAVDENLVKPVAEAYTKVVPSIVRKGVTNFFGNFGDAWSAVNNLLQGKLAGSLQDVMRVGTNTVFGLGGVLDVATEAGIDKQGEDFGQTLGAWGVEPGPYLVLPLFGPSTLRDTAAFPLDRAVSPAVLINDGGTQVGLTGLQLINARANLLSAGRLLDDIALDKYTFLRDAYLQRRRSQVYDGNLPEERFDQPEPAAAPAAAGSQ